MRRDGNFRFTKPNWKKLIILIFIYGLFVFVGGYFVSNLNYAGINNVAYVIMAQRLMGYPVFLTYFPTVIQVSLMAIPFGIEAWQWRKKHKGKTPKEDMPVKRFHYYYLWVIVLPD
jgi:hypothetical protein